MSGDLDVRQARLEDRDAVVSFTRDTWPELGGDYVPRVFEEWVETDGPTQRTFVATIDDRPVGICQALLLSDDEGWAQGMRVDPDYRGREISPNLSEAAFAWCGDRGATVCRNMVFSWNAAGLGQSRAVGFEPVCEFRWIEPEPDPDPEVDAAVGDDFDVRSDPIAAWRAFHGSDAYRELDGLGLALDESWVLCEVTRERLADAYRVLAVDDGDRVRATTFRTRTFEREDEDGEETRWAEYGVGAWDDLESFRALAGAVARDAAAQGASRARMLVPETPRHVSDAAAARVEFGDEPDFVLARDLTRYRAADG